ncbi:hypothetical protein A9Q02_13545 [Candidatus Chloroploca asiatica]|uniref:histidine kinase n=1 Tax=Candidatus Chloroploca asiatica TaxID=1506545 RepID=A0A2H3KM20_9CHLR|nr:hypothetical protein A9Q02_13545 [Candidatus Chloroploca asiatica]
MNRLVSQHRISRTQASYPLAVQGVALLALAAIIIAALGLDLPPVRLGALAGVCLAHGLALALVPARRLPRWAQVLYLLAQVGMASVAQMLAPAGLTGFVYLAVVLQAMVLFPLWLWIPFALSIYAVWSGLLLMATASFVTWLQGNLALAFPVTCAMIAVILYLRQQRRSEQVQQMLLQVQQHYDQLTSSLRDVQQYTMLEERRRLTQTIVQEVQVALSRTEQHVNSALNLAQANLSRLEMMVGQTRTSASQAVERLRGAVAALRGDDPVQQPVPVLPSMLFANDELVLNGRPATVLTWILPSVFVVMAAGLTLMRHGFSLVLVLTLLIGSLLLLFVYVATQRTRHTLLFQVGLFVQVLVILALTTLTHTVPLLIGLLLVLWQLSLRLALVQVLLYLIGLPIIAALLVARLDPVELSSEALMMGVVATVAVGGPLLLARSQLDRRKQTELRLSLLNAEVEQQMAEVRALAVAAERARMAREVHDELGSRLMLVSLQLQLAEAFAAEDAQAALEQLQISREHLRNAWSSVRRVADAELPFAAGTGTPYTALMELVQCSHDAIALVCEGELDELPLAVLTTIYRTVQEGLTNARKYAPGAAVSVSIVSLNAYVTVTLTNAAADTAPLSFSPWPTGGGFGLVGLRERVEALGGGLEAGPSAEGGWRVRVVLPA